MAEGQRVVAQAGRRWVSPVPGSEHASAQRRATLPASALAAVCTEVSPRLHAPPSPPLPGLESWAGVRAQFPRLALGAGSPLAARRKKPQPLQAQPGLVLAGRRRGMGEAFPHRPLWHLYTEAGAAKDNRFAPELLAALPLGGRLSLDLGGFSFLWVDDFPEQPKYGVPRRRPQTAVRATPLLSSSPYYRDELLEGGLPPSPPWRPPWRLVSVWWPGQG
jgi:hypothetical protein